LKISLEKAEKLKRSYGLDPQKEGGRIMLVLQNVLQGILNEIRKTISFYEQKNKRKISKILLCGGSSFLPKLTSYIAVEKLFTRKEFRKIIETEFHPVFFANVIGLAKRGLEKNPKTSGINLLSKGR